MDIFFRAAKEKVLFNYKGQLSVSDLFNLSLKALNELAIKYSKQMEDNGISFLAAEKPAVDSLTKLRFDIVIAIIHDREKTQKEKVTKEERRTKRAEIDALIAKAKQQELSGLSVEELEELRKNI